MNHAAGLCWEKVISPAPPKPPVHGSAFFHRSWRMRQIILQELLHSFLLLESCGVRGHSGAVMDGSQAYGVHMLIVLCLWISLSKCQGLRAAAGKMLKSFSSVYCASGKRFTAVTKTQWRGGGRWRTEPTPNLPRSFCRAVLSAAAWPKDRGSLLCSPGTWSHPGNACALDGRDPYILHMYSCLNGHKPDLVPGAGFLQEVCLVHSKIEK